jgi:hypothetical protein
MEVWQTILLAIGGNTALLAVLAWLARTLISQSFSRDLERHKAALLSETQSATERVRHDLQLVAQEHQVTFSKLHERRAAVIAEAYGLLVEAYWAGSSFASPIDFSGEPEKREKYVSAMNAMSEFYRFFDKNRIYLPEPICEAIDSLTKEMRSQVLRMGGYIKYKDDALPPAALEKKWEALDKAWDYFEKQAPAAKSLLEKELRLLIGDKPGVSPAS